MDSISPATVRIAGNHSDASGALATLFAVFGTFGKLMERHWHAGAVERSAHRQSPHTSPHDGLAP